MITRLLVFVFLISTAFLVSAKHHHHSAVKPNINAATPVAGDYEQYRGSPYTVGYDNRTFLINGGRKLLQSGAFHYPRATPSYWLPIMKRMRAAGLNGVETYVFWNLHEPVKGQYDFSTDFKNLPLFLQCAQDAGLFVTLRIGPYACAEWDFGGIPMWIRNQEHIQIRTNNSGWEHEMKTFLMVVLGVIEPYLARNGGPVILTQIENEYGNVQGSYGAAGADYVAWCGKTAAQLDVGTVWIMCQQTSHPANIVNTCNGFYCDPDPLTFITRQNAAGYPAGWTESYQGWFQGWGSTQAFRPAEDLAYAIAHFVELGGAMYNYYMYYGGTTFGRWAGNLGAGDITNYDYNSALNEYGFPSEPKFTHTTTLQRLLARYEAELVSPNAVPTPTSLGSHQQAYQYGKLVFLESSDTSADVKVTYQGLTTTLPAWSVSLYDFGDPAQPVFLFNTAQFGPVPESHNSTVNLTLSDLGFLEDVVGGDARVQYSVQANGPLEQTTVTNDTTDYLWYSVDVKVPSTGSYPLQLGRSKNYLYVYADGQLQYSNRGSGSSQTVTLKFSAAGTFTIRLLTTSLGLENYGAYYDNNAVQGVFAPVSFNGQSLADATWTHVAGMKGEALEYFTPDGADAADWEQFTAPLTTSAVWYRGTFHLDAIQANTAYTLDLYSMGKGGAYVNGHHIGRYWDVAASGSCPPCNYRGSWNENKCFIGCNQPSQRYYHVPRDWLLVGDNLVVLFAETARANPAAVIVRCFTSDA